MKCFASKVNLSLHFVDPESTFNWRFIIPVTKVCMNDEMFSLSVWLSFYFLRKKAMYSQG